MPDTEICPICKNPKKSGSSGSLTQWIAACTCDIAPAEIDEEAQRISVKICQDCGKRVNEGRAGSLTQFIFRSDVCQCQKPNIPEELFQTSAPLEEITRPLEEELETEFAHKIDGFPYERYKPLELLGKGTGGAVYSARDKMLNKKVAVKLLLNVGRRQLISFHEEAKATSRLDHPGIVKLLDFGASDSGIPYMVLEFIDGESLETRLEREKRLEWKEARTLFIQILDAIAYAHEHGLYHRDIKPSNILLPRSPEQEETIKIIDFGIAKAANVEEADTGKQGNTIVGAPFYMSPDQGLGKAYDKRSEVYSLGCVLFECLTGHPPFQGESAINTLAMHANQPAPSINETEPDLAVPRDLDILVQKALAKDPDRRFQSAEQFRSRIMEVEDVELFKLETDLKQEDSSSSQKILIGIAALAILGPLAVFGGIHFLNNQLEKNDKKYEDRADIDLKPLPTVEGVKETISDLGLDKKGWEVNAAGNSVIGRNITDEDMKELEGMELGAIKILPESKVTGVGLKYLNDDIRVISIASWDFNEEGAKLVKRFKKLKSLKIHSSHSLTDKAVEEMIKAPNLELLEIRYAHPLPPNAVAIISKKKSLRNVDLGHSEPITREQFVQLKKLPNLSYLRVSNSTSFTDSYVDMVKDMKLNFLDINGSAITDKGLLDLAECKNLKALRVSLVPEQLTEAGVKAFKIKNPNIKISVVGAFGSSSGVSSGNANLDGLLEDVARKVKKQRNR